jgi:hypothetical protein
MRSTFGTIFLIALLCGAVVAQDPPPPMAPPPVKESNADAWKEFSSAEGKFSISLPGTPTAEQRTMDTSIGKLTTHAFTLQTDFGVYYIAYIDFPVGPETPEENKQALDYSREQAVSGGVRLLVENDVTMAGAVGRELLIAKNRWIMRARYFYVKKRLYQIILTSLPHRVFKDGKPSANAADRTDLFEMVSKRLFDSFKVTQ